MGGGQKALEAQGPASLPCSSETDRGSCDTRWHAGPVSEVVYSSLHLHLYDGVCTHAHKHTPHIPHIPYTYINTPYTHVPRTYKHTHHTYTHHTHTYHTHYTHRTHTHIPTPHTTYLTNIELNCFLKISKWIIKQKQERVESSKGKELRSIKTHFCPNHCMKSCSMSDQSLLSNWIKF